MKIPGRQRVEQDGARAIGKKDFNRPAGKPCERLAIQCGAGLIARQQLTRVGVEQQQRHRMVIKQGFLGRLAFLQRAQGAVRRADIAQVDQRAVRMGPEQVFDPLVCKRMVADKDALVV